MKKESKKEKKEISVNVSKKENSKNNITEKSSKKEKNNKGNIFKSIGRYFRGVYKETKRIKWTNGKDLVKYSVAAVVFVLFFGLYFYGIDWIVLLVRSLAK